jgi:hypothetical protein
MFSSDARLCAIYAWRPVSSAKPTEDIPQPPSPEQQVGERAADKPKHPAPTLSAWAASAGTALHREVRDDVEKGFPDGSWANMTSYLIHRKLYGLGGRPSLDTVHRDLGRDPKQKQK